MYVWRTGADRNKMQDECTWGGDANVRARLTRHAFGVSAASWAYATLASEGRRGVVAAAEEGEVARPAEGDRVVGGQPHPQRDRVDDRVARHPQQPHRDVVLDGVARVLAHRVRQQRGGGRLALHALLQRVEDGEVDEGVVEEVVDGDLLGEVAHPLDVAQLRGERLRGELRHPGEPPREERLVEEPLARAEVDAAEGDEDGVPPPVDLLAPLDVPLDEQVAERRLHGGDDQVGVEGLRLHVREQAAPVRKPRTGTTSAAAASGRTEMDMLRMKAFGADARSGQGCGELRSRGCRSPRRRSPAPCERASCW